MVYPFSRGAAIGHFDIVIEALSEEKIGWDLSAEARHCRLDFLQKCMVFLGFTFSRRSYPDLCRLYSAYKPFIQLDINWTGSS